MPPIDFQMVNDSNLIITTFRLSFIVCSGVHACGPPAGVTLPPGFQLGKKYFWARSKTVGIDVALHTEFIFDIIFARGRINRSSENAFFYKDVS